jgi:hypothetical protein
MTTVYKLTDGDMRTRGGFQWKLGEEKTAPGTGELCTNGWLHAYTDPLLAVLLAPVHGAEKYTRLFRAEGEVGATNHGLKVGCDRMTLVEEMKLPEVTTEQRIRFGILCARKVCRDPGWSAWAERWLSGEDRTQEAAERAESAARAAAGAAAEWAARAAEWAAERAERAEAAAEAGAAEAAERAAEAAERAEEAAAWAAEAGAEAAAAWAAGAGGAALDLIGLAREAVSI